MENDWVDEGFEAERPRLRQVAARILGSTSEADARSEAWLPAPPNPDAIDSLSGWLTTVVSRITSCCVREARPDMPHAPDVPGAPTGTPTRARRWSLARWPALLAVLETCRRVNGWRSCSTTSCGVVRRDRPRARRSPPRRASCEPWPTACRCPTASADARRVSAVEAFLAASRNGVLAGLVALMTPTSSCGPTSAPWVRHRADDDRRRCRGRLLRRTRGAWRRCRGLRRARGRSAA
jgi:RNA polymerase sigma-70 factor (ECF subfamily)